MQYLEKEQLIKSVNINIQIKVDDLITADSYNEEEIINSFNSIDSDGRELLLKAAIHIAVIGSGNRTYGAIRDKNNNVIEIKDLFNKYKILYNKNTGEKYQKNSLSARRLVRLLRFHIQKFIVETGKPSYLWLKYSDKNLKMIPYCFPGGEHIVETEEEAKYLFNTYAALDLALNTKFQKRLERVFIARRIIKPLTFTSTK